MNKSIEELRDEFSNLLKKSSEEFMMKMVECQEEIILAFVAKYHLEPQQACMIYQGNKFWVENRIHIINHRLGGFIEARDMIEKLLSEYKGKDFLISSDLVDDLSDKLREEFNKHEELIKS